MPVVQQGREQRHPAWQAAAALCQCQRCVLVTDQLRQSRLCLTDSFSDSCLSEQDTDGQCVDEYSKGPVYSLSALHTAEQHRTEHHFLATCRAAQHLGPSPVEHARRADTQQSCLPPKAA